MRDTKNKALIAAAITMLIGALLHLLCIVFGGEWYIAMGAGKEMARLDYAGHWYPTAITLFITAVLIVWSLYALSGAKLIRKLPFLKTVLVLISAVLLIRAFAFVLLLPQFPDNSMTFWIVSSAACLIMGLFYSYGTWKAWTDLSSNKR